MVTAGVIALSVAFPVVFRTKPILPITSREQLHGMGKSAIRDMLSRQGWRLTAAFANQCDACISPSQHLAKILVEDGGLTTPCHVFPNGINTQRYHDALAADSPITKGTNDKFIISVARLSPEKRQQALVEALPHIPDENVKLVLVGGGPYEAELRAVLAPVADSLLGMEVHGSHLELRTSAPDDVARLLLTATPAGHLGITALSLEEIFAELVGNDHGHDRAAAPAA